MAPEPDNNPSGVRRTRSKDSIAFEQIWRALPRDDGAIPLRSAFQPRLAKPFLPYIILAQAPSLGDPTIRIRIVGDAIRQHAQENIVGRNLLDLIDEEDRKARALDIVREMFEKPCGQWWVLPVHYERGFSQYWELTSFPLAAYERSPAMVLALVRPVDSLRDPKRTRHAAVRIDAPVQLEVIPVEP